MTNATRIKEDALRALEVSGKFKCYQALPIPGGYMRLGYEASKTACQGKRHVAYYVLTNAA